MRSRFYPIVLCIAVFVVVLNGCREKSAPVAPKPPTVNVVPATEGYILESSTVIAAVKADDEVNLVARVEGFLIKRLFEEGKPVKKGQLLYEIEPEIYNAKVKAAEAELEKSYANQKNANIEYERQKTLDAQDATSKRAFDNATAGKQEADAEVKGAEANLALAKQNLSYTKIFSPFDGQIGLNTYSVGNLVGQSSGTLATVVKVDPARVEFVITELELIKLLQSRKDTETPDVRIRLFLQDGTEYNQAGKISYWSNEINTSTGTLQMQAVFPNPKRELVAGMFARVTIGPAEPLHALMIPLVALMTDQAGDYVYVVDPAGKVKRCNVALGYRDKQNVVVESGLAPGDKVIVEGIQKVRPGGSATPQEDGSLLALIPTTIEKVTGVKAQKPAKPMAEAKTQKPAKPAKSEAGK
ncbi:MAG: efflux RND transporter periplasmic adaptor subunit [Victivallales bacterium]|jgi:membrane fusion protein (multidrug efflux system)|nr:efflux RND transporter periplasmic adaptor subunit [Victivallales bacterium]